MPGQTLTDKNLLEYAKTQTQYDAVYWTLELGSANKAANHLGKSRRTVDRAIEKVRYNAAERGYAPDNDMFVPTAAGYNVKGTSTLYDADGNIKQQWVKTDKEKEKEDQLREFIEETEETFKTYKALPKIKAPKKTKKDVLCIYPMGDPHVGMYAWHEETGADFDCDIAERDLRMAMGHLVEKTPDSEEAIILNLGDFFHSDTQLNRTQRGGNALDVDGRWARVLQIGVAIMLDCINLALEKHKRVRVRNNPGNHDPHTAQVLSICLAQAFRNNNRVIIESIANPFYCHTFGKNMITSTHGDMVKPTKMHGVVTNYFPKEWGESEHRYCFLGHFHHENRVEENGLVVEIFNTLASQDAWHHASGYKSRRNMKALVLDSEHGEVERYTFSINR